MGIFIRNGSPSGTNKRKNEKKWGIPLMSFAKNHTIERCDEQSVRVPFSGDGFRSAENL